MSKIDPKELKMAMREAARMREANEDPYFLATSLLNQNFRIRQLEGVAKLAEEILRNGTSEELLLFLDQLQRVVEGQNVTAATDKAAMAARLLLGNTKTHFLNQLPTTTTATTNNHFDKAINTVKEHVFPKQAADYQ